MTDDHRLRIMTVCSATRGVYGAVQSMLTLADAEIQAGHHVEFITRKGKTFRDELMDLGYQATDIAIRTKIDPIAITQMARYARRRKFDVIHCHLSTASLNGTLAGRLARIPAISTVHGLSGKLSFVTADHVIAVSQMVKQHLINQGFKESKISVVYNGIPAPTNLPKSERSKELLGLSHDGPIIGTVSRVTPSKGIEYAIRAMVDIIAKYPKAKYLLVGDGDALESSEALAAELGISDHIVFAGYQKDVYRYLSAMDVMLFPSLQEGMGMALVEAFLARVPVVGTNVGGIPEVVSHECGLTVEPADSKALAESTIRLLGDTELRGSIIEHAYRKATTLFCVESMLARTERIFRGLLGEGPSLPLEPEYGLLI